MKRWDTFVVLCGYLRAGLLADARSGPGGGVRWELLIEASSHHFVTPALAWCLRDQPDLPPEIRDYFDATLVLNGQRNERLIGALGRIGAALNAIDIEPVLLKGAARLIDGVYPAAKLRYLGDLDLLIPGDRAAEAAAALKRIGFDAEPGSMPAPVHHHLPMLRERDTGAAVELHTALGSPALDPIVSAAWFCENASAVRLLDSKVRLPDPTRSVAHNVVHDQLNHGNYGAGQVQLRQLLDLAMIRAKYESAIDWAELDRRFCSVGMGPVLATYLEFASVLFGQTAPELSHAPRKGALVDLRRKIEWPAIRTLVHLRTPIDYVLARRGDPVGLLKRLLAPQTWSTVIRLVKDAFDKPKW